MSEAMEFANMLATSNIVPAAFQAKPADILVAIQWGMELGLQPMQALQNIAVINGRPSVWGDALLAIVRADPRCLGVHEEIDGEVASCTIKRQQADGSVEAVKATFSMRQAAKAGLAGKKGPWTSYPERMLQMRARGFAIRDAFPDLLKGIITSEEAQDTPEPREATGLDSVLIVASEPPLAAEALPPIEPPVNDAKWIIKTAEGKVVAETLTQEAFTSTWMDLIANARNNRKAKPLNELRHWLAETKEANIAAWNELDADLGEALEEDYQTAIKYFSVKIKEETDELDAAGA
jgi:hypothetical protein